jgi:hypothetical protein
MLNGTSNDFQFAKLGSLMKKIRGRAIKGLSYRFGKISSVVVYNPNAPSIDPSNVYPDEHHSCDAHFEIIFGKEVLKVDLKMAAVTRSVFGPDLDHIWNEMWHVREIIFRPKESQRELFAPFPKKLIKIQYMEVSWV